MIEIMKNELRTKTDLADALKLILEPLEPYYSTSNARISISKTGVGYGDKTAGMETLLRLLWGIAPLYAGGNEYKQIDNMISGIVNGTNPEHDDYWGSINDYDQKTVEVASLGYTLLLAPKTILEKLSKKEKTQVVDYLRKVNEVKVYDCNWLFFPVLINIGLKNIGESYDQSVIDSNLNHIDTFYIGDGWYKDGIVAHIDYYVSFAIHFYSLVYAYAMEKDDPARSKMYKERAKLFIEHFKYWVSEEGQFIPYGRSMTYRFSQTAFFTAYILAEVNPVDTGWIKGVILRHMRYWLKQPIFNGDGTLSVGYAYPNLIMSENYNSPGSPYWALKSFLPLALPDNHLFWRIKEEPLPKMNSHHFNFLSEQTICKRNSHVVLFPSGDKHTNAHNHVEAKYEKFAYSTHFGFSVPRGHYSLEQGAYDSMLALSEDGEIYQVKRKVIEKQYTQNFIYMKWQVLKNVTVETWIYPGLPWHARVHKVQTDRELTFADGGFSLNKKNEIEKINTTKPFGIMIKDSKEASVVGAIALKSEGICELINPNSNTNLIHPTTVLPTISGKLKPGKHTLIHAFYGGLDDSLTELQLDAVNMSGDMLNMNGRKIKLNL